MQDHTTHESSQEIPYGYCHCGCGQSVRIADKTRTKNGWVKGEPVRFIKGHTPYISPVVRFWWYVTPGVFDQCWEWKGSRNQKGYGMLRVNGTTISAHRLSWEIHFGPIPEENMVLHKCDNPPCCNPYCLFLGDNATNMADMVAKGRQKCLPRWGESNGSNRISTSHVIEIRFLHSKGITGIELARRFGVSDATISRIVNRVSWAHLP